MPSAWFVALTFHTGGENGVKKDMKTNNHQQARKCKFFLRKWTMFLQQQNQIVYY